MKRSTLGPSTFSPTHWQWSQQLGWAIMGQGATLCAKPMLSQSPYFDKSRIHTFCNMLSGSDQSIWPRPCHSCCIENKQTMGQPRVIEQFEHEFLWLDRSQLWSFPTMATPVDFVARWGPVFWSTPIHYRSIHDTPVASHAYPSPGAKPHGFGQVGRFGQVIQPDGPKFGTLWPLWGCKTATQGQKPM